MTSAPRSASVRVQIGPAQPIEKSITRTPSRGRRFAAPASGAGARAATPDGHHNLRLADVRNGSAAPRRRAGQSLHGTRGKPGLVADHDRDDGSARPLLGIADEITDAGHRHDRDFSPQPLGEPFLRGALLQLRNELAFDFFHALQPIDAHDSVASSRRSWSPSISQKARHCAGVTVVTPSQPCLVS